MNRTWIRGMGVAAGLVFATSCMAASASSANTSGVAWLVAQHNVDDGSWGATDALKYVQTSEAVLALAALNQQGPAYFEGVAWLSNHAPVNVDYTVRRVLALGAANAAVVNDMAVLQSTQNQAAPGNNGWGLSSSYQGSTLDTALALQALAQQGSNVGVANAVNYLLAAQLTGADTGWALGSETSSDPTTTAQVLIALIPLQSQYSGAPAAIAKGLAALNAKVSASLPTAQIALAVVANLRSNPSSSQGASLLSTLMGQQAADGSWGEDPYVTALALRASAAGLDKDLQMQKQIISVPDAALRTAINNALGHGAMDIITLGQIQSLTSLDASGRGISNLTGLQYAINLTTLNLSNNNISSFAVVAPLTNTAINESGNPGTAVVSDGNGDTPTLPEWGAIVLGIALLFQALKTRRRG